MREVDLDCGGGLAVEDVGQNADHHARLRASLRFVEFHPLARRELLIDGVSHCHWPVFSSCRIKKCKITDWF